MKLSSENVHKVFMNCLFDNNEPTDKAVLVHGANLNVGFNPIKLEKNKLNIVTMLNCLPDNFMEGKGGGWSFLNLTNDKDDNQWTSSQHVIDQLVTLGLALSLVLFPMPRLLWDALPGGMPYVIIKNLKQLRKEKLTQLNK